MRRPLLFAISARYRRLTPLWLLAGLCLFAVAPAAAGDPPPFLRFSVQDEDGNFFPRGEVEFCLADGRCLYADIDPGFPGHFSIPSSELIPGAVYTVMVYNPDVDVIYETWDWVYAPQDYDPGFDRLLDIEKFEVYAQFRGLEAGGLAFEITNTLNPEWERRAGLATGGEAPGTVLDYPRLVTSFEVPVMAGGRFGSDPEAAGGVLGVDAGIGLNLSWRRGYPRRLYRDERWVPFRELGFSYASNRYETAEIITPGRTSDVTFHRVAVAYGIGRMSPSHSSHWSVAGKVALGAVLDGTRTLEFMGRSYRMFGVGVQARFIQQVFGGGGVRAGLMLQADLTYYPADTNDDDFWFGAAPSVSLGLAFY